MKKSLILCLLVLVLIPITRALDCYPTISWRMDSQFYIGETSKLIATITNPCDENIRAVTEINTQETYGYIKVYTVPSELENPTPKPHDINTGSPMVSVELDKAGEDEAKQKVVFYIQPDELTPLGTYTIYENFYVEGELRDTKEVTITVKKPLQITYQLPSSMKFGTPFSASITINNIGTESLKTLKICVSSPENIVSFSESCKTWTNIPSKYTDKFSFTVNSIIPGDYQNAIKVDIYYTPYTSLNVYDSYNQPSLKITTTQSATPSLSFPQLSYTPIRKNENLTLQITNRGNGSAYRCIATLTYPDDCPLEASSLISSSKSDEGNIYEIDCGSEIPIKSGSSIILTFKPDEIKPSCFIKGMISYRDSTGKILQTGISNLYLQAMTTTIKPFIPPNHEKNILYIILIAIVAIIAVVLVFLKYKKPLIWQKLVGSVKTLFSRISLIFKKPKLNKVDEK